ncbi:lysophospholipid acyltransferase family protein [Streptantibioticus cattleyicolor]|uniref:lysophospholipid acyltransferase family protein n=1 Tax=Streptantibioticus cattleyicolor TaxID=29303 RepID=UPI000213E29E|nr:lysophospholipid acyltransferase family protein [Streptantibioticus cattleyicolor]CCB72295.1 Phospholipid/glycerol acyltransferase [Streptantibioticus cattleyicolor NRRL 8057 = DSM 46488]
MLGRVAGAVVPFCGRLTVTADAGAVVPPGAIVVANHTSLADPAVVLAALHRLGVRPVVLAAAGLWRVPVLGRVLAREGHVPVHRDDPRAGWALPAARAALDAGRPVLIYPEGGLPRRRDAAEAPPRPFRAGLFHLARTTGAPVVPLGQAGARRLLSGGPAGQVARALSAPLRRPALHVHLGAPLRLTGPRPDALAQAHHAVTAAWRTAARHLGEPVPEPSGLTDSAEAAAPPGRRTRRSGGRRR